MNILLDTVTLSAFRKLKRAEPKVIEWQNSLPADPVAVSVITLNELRYGIRKVEKKDPIFATHLSLWYQNIISTSDFFKILPITREIAETAGDFRAFYNSPYNDSLIAATAEIHNLSLATRNVADFQECGIQLINPWDFETPNF